MAVKPKLPSVKGGMDEGPMKGEAAPEKFDKPREMQTMGVEGMGSLKNDIGEKSGFQIDGYLDKKSTPYGEAAKFNFMPPGMDISAQKVTDIRNMPLKKVVDIGYPGDGWDGGSIRDVPET
jgi:hypothetical protein